MLCKNRFGRIFDLFPIQYYPQGHPQEGNIDDRSIRTQKGIKDGDLTPLTPEEALAYAKSLPEQSKKRNEMIANDQKKQLLHGEEMSIRARLDVAGIGYRSGANLAELRQLNASHFGGQQQQQGPAGFPGGIPTFLTIEQQAILLEHENKKNKKEAAKKESPKETEPPADLVDDEPASEPDPTDDGSDDQGTEDDPKTKIITQEDLDENPELVDQGVKVGDEVELGEEIDPPADPTPEDPSENPEVKALQDKYKEKFPDKDLSKTPPRFRNNAEWLKGKLAE